MPLRLDGVFGVLDAENVEFCILNIYIKDFVNFLTFFLKMWQVSLNCHGR